MPNVHAYLSSFPVVSLTLVFIFEALAFFCKGNGRGDLEEKFSFAAAVILYLAGFFVVVAFISGLFAQVQFLGKVSQEMDDAMARHFDWAKGVFFVVVPGIFLKVLERRRGCKDGNGVNRGLLLGLTYFIFLLLALFVCYRAASLGGAIVFGNTSFTN